uniref:Uncharacterized protein n=1 Tax=Arundo donax TaxID=35708 RepID=A0A0A9E3N5_ARUDO
MAMTQDRHSCELEMTSMWRQISYWKLNLVELTCCNFAGKPSRAQQVVFQDERTLGHAFGQQINGQMVLSWFIHLFLP